MLASAIAHELGRLVDHAPEFAAPLCDRTSFRVGGPADALLTVGNSSELLSVLRYINKRGLEFRVIGKGTNLVVRDHGFSGVIIILAEQFNTTSYHVSGDEVIVDVGAACSLSGLSRKCLELGYSGLEFGIGIPGTLGGAVMMNAGAWGGEIADILESIQVFTDQGETSLSRDELEFHYRKLVLPGDGDQVIGSARLRLRIGNSLKMRQACNEIVTKRKTTQPVGFGNAGSIFKNPKGDSAGRLIESCGLKGYTIGGAEVSEKHANFIINRGHATAADILRLIQYIQDVVEKKSGIRLDPEVHVL